MNLVKKLKKSDLHQLDLWIGDLIKNYGETMQIRDVSQRIMDEINFRHSRK